MSSRPSRGSLGKRSRDRRPHPPPRPPPPPVQSAHGLAVQAALLEQRRRQEAAQQQLSSASPIVDATSVTASASPAPNESVRVSQPRELRGLRWDPERGAYFPVRGAPKPVPVAPSPLLPGFSITHALQRRESRALTRFRPSPHTTATPQQHPTLESLLWRSRLCIRERLALQPYTNAHDVAHSSVTSQVAVAYGTAVRLFSASALMRGSAVDVWDGERTAAVVSDDPALAQRGGERVLASGELAPISFSSAVTAVRFHHTHIGVSTLGDAGISGGLSLFLADCTHITLATLPIPDRSVFTFDWHPSNTAAIVSASHSLFTADTVRGTVRKLLSLKTDILSIQALQHEYLIVVGARNGSLFTVDTRFQRQDLSTRMRHPLSVLCVRVMPNDANYVVASAADGSMRLWDWRMQRAVIQYSNVRAPTHFGISEDGQFLCGGDDRVRLWDTQRADPIAVSDPTRNNNNTLGSIHSVCAFGASPLSMHAPAVCENGHEGIVSRGDACSLGRGFWVACAKGLVSCEWRSDCDSCIGR